MKVETEHLVIRFLFHGLLLLSVGCGTRETSAKRSVYGVVITSQSQGVVIQIG